MEEKPGGARSLRGMKRAGCRATTLTPREVSMDTPSGSGGGSSDIGLAPTAFPAAPKKIDSFLKLWRGASGALEQSTVFIWAYYG